MKISYVSLALLMGFLTGCATPSMKRTIASNLKEVMQAVDCDTACAKSCTMLRARVAEEVSKLEK